MGKAKGGRCACCEKVFKPNPRLGQRQKTCGEPACRRFHRAQYRRRYREANSVEEAEYRKTQNESRGTEFWKLYREAHPESTERNRANSRLRKQLKRAGLQRQLDIVQLVDPPEKLDAIVEFATSHRSLLQECQRKKRG